MSRVRLDEYTIPEGYDDFINRILQREGFWGMTMNIQVNRALDERDRNSALYMASRMAEAKGLDYMLFRDNIRDIGFVISAERGSDNLPVYNERRRNVPDDLYIRLLMNQAEAGMLPNFYMSEWKQFLSQGYDEGTLNARETAEIEAANLQYNMRNTDVTVRTGSGDAVDPDTATGGEPAGGAGSEEERAAPARADGDSPLARFASSGQGGIANNPEEEDAIRELQTFLVDLGLDVGRNGVDGRYGPRTTQAVKDFQNAATEHLGYDLLSSDGNPDGDAGPITIPAVIAVRNDLQEIDRLVTELRSEDTREGFIPVHLKSGLSKLFEQLLFEDDRGDLQNLLDRYEPFIQQFPSATINQSPGSGRPSVFNQAREILGRETTEPAATTGTTQVPNGPFLDGMVVTPEINDRLEAVGREQGIVGERLSPEDIAALNRGVADNTITAPANITPTEPAATDSGINWDEITLAPEDIQDELGVPTESVILQGERGEEYIYVFIDAINGTEIEYIVGSATGTPSTANVPEGLAFTINQEIERRSGTEAPETDPRIEWPAPFNTDPWPEEFNQTGNEIKGTDLLQFPGEEGLTEARWILKIRERTLDRVTELNLSDIRTYTDVRIENLNPVADYEGEPISLRDYDNLVVAIIEMDEFNEIPPAEYGNDFTENVAAYWATYKDRLETDRFLRTIERNREWTLEELNTIKQVLARLATSMGRGTTTFTIDGNTVQGPSREVPSASTELIRNFITNTIDNRISQLEHQQAQAARSEAAQQAGRLYDLLDQHTNAAEFSEIESIVLGVTTREGWELLNREFQNLQRNRSRDSIFRWFNTEGLSIPWLRHDMSRIRAHLQSLGVDVSRLHEDEVISMFKRLNTLLGSKT